MRVCFNCGHSPQPDTLDPTIISRTFARDGETRTVLAIRESCRPDAAMFVRYDTPRATNNYAALSTFQQWMEKAVPLS